MTNSTTPTTSTTTLPAIACTLKGAYLIEASAGTGKTWTLTGIILRLLVEEKYAPERIVATTFTRAAAAEMQERIQERLVVFYRYLNWIKSKQSLHDSWFDASMDIQERLDDIVSQASMANVEGFEDPINVHLIGYLLNQDVKDFDEAIRRVGLLLATLDKLFVGTLDSLAQKWLKEFSAEIGHRSKMDILYDSADMTTAIIHDALRHTHAHVMTQEPRLYELIRHSNIFSDVKKAYESVNLTMQFFGVPIDEIDQIDDEFLKVLQGKVDEFLRTELSSIQAFADKDYRTSVGVNGRNALMNGWHHLFEIVELLRQFGINAINHLQESHIKWLDAIDDAIEKDKFFNKKHDECAKQTLMTFIEKHVSDLEGIYQQIKELPSQYRRYLYRKIALEVQQKIPAWLENQRKTTFTIQMNRLNEALKSNPNLARHIRHHYPVALIDESQDVNGAQVELIHQVYLSKMIRQAKTKKVDDQASSRGFLLLVGDPKQAIYRFRGGDVANYNYMKSMGVSHENDQPIINQDLTLTVNRRSNGALIESLNSWFSGGENNCHADLGDGIYYQKITAHNQTQRVSWQSSKQQLPSYLGHLPFAVLQASNDSEHDMLEMLTWHINSLLQGKHTIQTSNGQRAIQPNDIAVLSGRHVDLSNIKACLDALHIPSIAAREVNVFQTKAGLDIHTLLLACMEMGNVEKLGRLLTSSLFGQSIDEAMAILGGDDDGNDAIEHKNNRAVQDKQKQELLIYLNKIFDKWRLFGITDALNFALSTYPFSHQAESLWLAIAPLGERYLADVWQILQLVGEQAHLPQLAFFEWYEASMMAGLEVPDDYKRQALPSESGVNLMTIHQSKGLEFPIVYVLGLDKAVSANNTVFYPYSNEQFQRRISPTPHQSKKENHYKELDQKESLDEKKRLAYVALTRASEQVYVVTQELRQKKQLDLRPLFLWCETTDITLTMPSRMQNQMDWLNLDAQDYIKMPYESDCDELSLIDYHAWNDVIPNADFFGECQTSFTSLVDRLERSRSRLVGHSDYGEVVLVGMTDETVVDDIRHTFMRGLTAGDFLHQVLQKVPVQGEPSQILQNISRTVDEVARLMGLTEYMSQKAQKLPNHEMTDDKNTPHRQLVLWIDEIIHAPFAASGMSLCSLNVKNSVRELGFLLGIKQGFGIDELNAVFAKYCDKPMSLFDDKNRCCYRHLKGEIDLMYEHDGRFYILDYKSNFLGSLPQDYHPSAMNDAMDAAGYWLQAAIYQVALHRLLKMRISDYVGNEHKYLGSVEYLFLRGITNDHSLGRLVWEVPIELVRHLDNLLS
ncbi:UvrD-helicase domain-containing protein [Moraxella oculi]|uniref:RecBCD enzyme subunit RecB n=1 Tax=Moraxella oculi TaxID=2940516 RepID=A0ABW8U575_9GAMM